VFLYSPCRCLCIVSSCWQLIYDYQDTYTCPTWRIIDFPSFPHSCCEYRGNKFWFFL
jgi:hypothetical protein